MASSIRKDAERPVAAGDAAVVTRGPGLALALGGLVIGLLIWTLGLPTGWRLFGSDLVDLRIPAAVLAVLLGLWLAGFRSAARPRWRVVDVVVASVLGVAGGALFVAWNLGWNPLSAALAGFPPASALGVGVWLLPGVLGGLVVRKMGAAVYTETVAATLSALYGNEWGFATVWYGLLEGLGAEVVFALLLWRRWGLPVALAAGASAGVVVGVLDTFLYYPSFEPGYKVAYLAFAVLSGTVLAGAGSWALTKALAKTGALAPLASGRDARRV